MRLASLSQWSIRLVLSVLLASCAPAATPTPAPTAAPATPAAVPAKAQAQPSPTPAAKPTGGAPYRIGAVLSLTGAVAANGIPTRRGIELAVDEINKAGGVQGRPLEVIFEDDQSKPDVAVTATNKLINQDQVIAILGGSFGSTANAMSPVIGRANLVHLTPTGVVLPEQRAMKHVFYFLPNIPDFALGMLDVAKQLDRKRIALLRLTREYGQVGAQTFHDNAAKYGVQIVADEQGNDGDTDFTAQLTKIRGTNPDMLVVWFANPAGAIALKNVRQLGIDAPIIAPLSMATKPLIEIAGPAAENVFVQALVSPDDPAPRQKAFVDAFRAKFSAEPEGLDAVGYDMVKVLAAGLAKLQPGQVDSAQLIQAIEGIRLEGAGSLAEFSAERHEVDRAGLLLLQVKGGKFLRAQLGSSR